MPWTLYFPFATVDDRVSAREHISVLRRDPAVIAIQPTYVRGQPFVVNVEFREGLDAPQDPRIRDRIDPFRSPLPPREPVQYLPPPGEPPPHVITLEPGEYPPERPNQNGDLIPQQLRDQIIEQYLMTAPGRTQLAQAMAMPLRRSLDYSSVARRTLLIDELPQGALPIYNRDPDVVGSALGPSDLDFVLPEWVRVGSFARFKWDGPEAEDPGRIVEITAILDPNDPPGRNGPLYVRVQTWRDASPGATDDIRGYLFVNLWEPCERPPDPRTAWERLLGDPFDDD